MSVSGCLSTTCIPCKNALLGIFTHEKKTTTLLLLQHDSSAGQQLQRKDWELDLVSQTFGVSSSSDLFSSLGRLRCGKVSSGSTYYASQNRQGHWMWTPKWCAPSCCSIPDIGNPIHVFAKGKCHWQCEILKKGLRKWKSEGVGGIFNTKVSCLEIKTSTALGLVLKKH